MSGSILIVDDEFTLAETIRDHFAAEGFDAERAASGEAALELVRARRFDVVVTDMKMPGMSGLDLLGALREAPDTPAVVMMTAYGTLESAVEAFRLGLFDFLEKPVSLDELSRSVKRALGVRAARATAKPLALPLQVLRERSRRVGPVRAEVAGDASAGEATAVWHLRSLDRKRTAFIWGHVVPQNRYAASTRLIVRTLADAVDLGDPGGALEAISSRLGDLDCLAALQSLAVGVVEPKPNRRVHGAASGYPGVFRLCGADSSAECLVDGPGASGRRFETVLAPTDVLLLAEPRLVSAAGERWPDVLATTAQCVADGELRPAQRLLAKVPEAAHGAPVAVALRLGETIRPDELTHVSAQSSLASLAHLRDTAEQFALSSPLSDQAAHEVVTAVQEALLNCIRWAYPGREGLVYLTLSRGAKRMRASVRDRGLGFDVADVWGRTSEWANDPLRCSGRGLMLMDGLADRFELVSRPGRGTNVVLEKEFDLPVAADAAAHEVEHSG